MPAKGCGGKVVLVGDSGIGKSTILKELRNVRIERGVTKAIDLGAARNRSSLGLAASLLQDFEPKETAEFYGLSSDAQKTGAEKLARGALRICQALVTKLAPENKVFLFDNVDKASAGVRAWFFRGVLSVPGLACVASARVLPNVFPESAVVPIQAFGHDRLKRLGAFWAQYLALSVEEVIDRLVNTTGGHPVRAVLLAWALSRLESRSAPRDTLSQVIARCMQEAEIIDVRVIEAAVFAYQRANAKIFEHLLSLEEPSSAVRTISEMPFTEEIDDLTGGLIVHPVALKEIEIALGLEYSKIEVMRKRLAEEVYPRLMGVDLGSEVLGPLELERLRYLAGLNDPSCQLQVERAFRTHILGGRLSRADEIAQMVGDALESATTHKPLAFTLITAENCVSLHEIKDAARILGAIEHKDLAVATQALQARVQYLKAKCITSPAAVNGAEIFDAVGILENALRDAMQEHGTDELVEEIRMELGQAYRLTGRNSEAIKCYQLLEEKSTNSIRQVRAVEETANLYRLMQDLDKAEVALNRATSRRMEAGLEVSSFSFYNLANIRRDQAEFAVASTFYERALAHSLDDRDDYLSCTVYGDWAWMKLLNNELDESRRLLDNYRHLAEIYGFSRELSEYWHMTYHLDVVADDWEAAYYHLDQALKLALEYGNILMQLDCMMHQVQKAVRQKAVEQTLDVIHQMESIEDRGCGIKVFRGRARIYQGDGLLEEGKERDAVIAWKQGFETVANFGHSRSNLELLSDLLVTRRERFFGLLKHYESGSTWPEACTPVVRDRIVKALETAEGRGDGR
ncbi:MAG: hypothetical protein WAN65_14550 [Candidatus Sulfotelmatobacter sp.]